MIEAHSWITAAVYPLVNGFCALALLACYRKSKSSISLLLLGLASLLSFGISALWLFLRVQKSLLPDGIPDAIGRSLWVVQAIAEYASIALFVSGVVVLTKYFSDISRSAHPVNRQ